MYDVTWHLLTLGCYGIFGYCDTTEVLKAGTEHPLDELHSFRFLHKIHCTREPVAIPSNSRSTILYALDLLPSYRTGR